MIQRKEVPVNDEYSVAVVTEDMADGRWAFVATVKHRSPSGEQIVDLPVQSERYADQHQAEDAGLTQARAWLTQNVPHVA
jgi:hypothetical protein